MEEKHVQAEFDSNRHLPVIYDELKRLAISHMNREGKNTLQPTALVHEAWIRLSSGKRGATQWSSRSHFYYSAATAMKWILIEHARKKNSQKRGGHWKRVPLQDFSIEEANTDLLLHLEEALERLMSVDPEAAAVASLHLFGAPLSEISEALGISRTTAHRNWIYARTFLQKELAVSENS